MSDRRALIDGLKTTPAVAPAVERGFVFGAKAAPEPPKTTPAAAVARTPLTTKLRADYVAALKRASLERQLAGQTPHTLQDFLEEALGPWLERHGYHP